jgi:hypothetical protein
VLVDVLEYSPVSQRALGAGTFVLVTLDPLGGSAGDRQRVVIGGFPDGGGGVAAETAADALDRAGGIRGAVD